MVAEAAAAINAVSTKIRIMDACENANARFYRPPLKG
jgi:hypothetical protein